MFPRISLRIENPIENFNFSRTENITATYLQSFPTTVAYLQLTHLIIDSQAEDWQRHQHAGQPGQQALYTGHIEQKSSALLLALVAGALLLILRSYLPFFAALKLLYKATYKFCLSYSHGTPCCNFLPFKILSHSSTLP